MKNKILLLAISFLCLFTLISCGKKYGELNTILTDELKLTRAYEGKEFIADGIGEVHYISGVDGDTTTFRSVAVTFKLRYYGINTPESTGVIEAWGKKASKFTTSTLANAVKNKGKIVLECDIRSERQDSNKRYLGYVWYQPSEGADFRLLNLEIVEQAYSAFVPSASSYDTYFSKANANAKATNRRIWGEKDVNFSYSKQNPEVTISELYENAEAYEGSSQVVTVEAQILRIVGENLYIRDINPTLDENNEEYYAAIYVFVGYVYKPSTFLQLGDIVKFTASLQTHNGNYQLSNVNFSDGKYEITGHTDVELYEITSGSQLTDRMIGQAIKAELIIEKVSSTDNTSYTLYCQLADGTELNVRINQGTGYTRSNFVAGETWMFSGGLTKYYEDYQIELGNNKIYKDASFVKK